MRIKKKNNPKKIGKKFELECIPILKEIFEEVEWCSGKNATSPYDFKCIKKGKEYMVEAKFLSKNKNKPKLTYSQSNVDLVICKKGGELFIYEKDTVLNNFRISTQISKRDMVKSK